MRLLKVASCVLNQTPLDWQGNVDRIRHGLKMARDAGASVVCLPELCLTGYGCEDVFLSPGLHKITQQLLLDLLPDTSGMLACVGLPIPYQASLYNSVAVLADGKLLGFVAKHHLPVEGVHYEPRWFKPWAEGKVGKILVGRHEVPIGELVFEVDGIKVGFEICEDAWSASRPGRELAKHGVDIILNPSASHFAFAKYETRKRFVIEGSRAFGAAYLYANHLGNEAGRVIYDGSALIASGGRLVALGERFSFQDVLITSAVVDIDLNRLNRSRQAASDPENGSDSGSTSGYQVVNADCKLPHSKAEKQKLAEKPWESSVEIKEHEFCRAVALGLFDYLRKSRARGFVISLSGGVDSSASACLVALMLALAQQELGPAKLRQKLSYIPGLEAAKSSKELLSKLLTCVYQATVNSSQATEDAARELASELGAQYVRVGIDEIVSKYSLMAEAALGIKLNWTDHDAALQNIQARVRGPFVWLLANLNQALLLATSNRSEAAVGYTTMDGDTCGGLSPIGGVDKAFLLKWLQWLHLGGLPDLGAVQTLRLVLASPPSAELRPAAQNQTDESDLMPYPVLDLIERLAIRDKLLPHEILELVTVEQSRYSVPQLKAWIDRFFRLWSKNQWKRERYAPSFHLDDENLDPKTWCRFPILSGGFAFELEKLKSSV